MGKQDKILEQVLLGRADANIAFTDLRNLLRALGFAEQIRGDHYIFTKHGVDEIMNLQSIGAKAKPYQVRQVRNVILKYKLGL
jgi:virulence-associated protein VapD